MLHGAPPAAGPIGTVGRARATPELHGAVQRGTVGRGLNRDHRVKAASYARLDLANRRKGNAAILMEKNFSDLLHVTEPYINGHWKKKFAHVIGQHV